MKIENDIIELCKSNNRAAQKKLYHILLPQINFICRRYLRNHSDVKDVIQNTFIRFFKNLNQYDSSKGELKSWIIKIAVNCCFTQNEKHAKKQTQEFVISIHDQQTSPEILDQFSNEDLMKFLKKMPEQYFQVFNLHIIDGFSHKEIADLLNIGEVLSRKRLSRGRAWLEKNIEGIETRNWLKRRVSN